MTQLNYSCDAIIVNYNAGKLLSGCVASVFSQGITHAIVVDNASADDSMACLADMQVAELTFICNARNLGFSAACNMGFMASSSPYLLFLNPDCTLEAGALGRLIEVLENAPDIGMVGGLLCNLDGSEQPGGGVYSPRLGEPSCGHSVFPGLPVFSHGYFLISCYISSLCPAHR